MPNLSAISQIESKPWGESASGQEISLYTLTNPNGITVKLTNLGAIITSIVVPDKHGNRSEVALGYDNLDAYLTNNKPHFGAVCGRYANRIAKGKFALDGAEYQLPINNGPNALHGGIIGFDKKVWSGTPVMSPAGPALILTYTSRDGEEGFPGNLDVKVVYTLTEANELKIEYTATTDQPTVINLTNHSYFNLAGAGSGSILNQTMMINADCITPTDSTSIPTGEFMMVADTPFDFRTPHSLGERIDADHEQIKFGSGYDHNYVLNQGSERLKFAARASDPVSGRKMEVYTTQPGIQLYTANHLNGKYIGHHELEYLSRGAFCLETQHFPDSPNHPSFPTTRLNPGELYEEVAIFKFGW